MIFFRSRLVQILIPVLGFISANHSTFAAYSDRDPEVATQIQQEHENECALQSTILDRSNKIANGLFNLKGPETLADLSTAHSALRGVATDQAKLALFALEVLKTRPSATTRARYSTLARSFAFRSAQQKDPDGLFALGKILLDETGNESKPYLARYCIEESAILGHRDAQYLFLYMDSQQIGGPHNDRNYLHIARLILQHSNDEVLRLHIEQVISETLSSQYQTLIEAFDTKLQKLMDSFHLNRTSEAEQLFMTAKFILGTLYLRNQPNLYIVFAQHCMKLATEKGYLPAAAWLGEQAILGNLGHPDSTSMNLNLARWYFGMAASNIHDSYSRQMYSELLKDPQSGPVDSTVKAEFSIPIVPAPRPAMLLPSSLHGTTLRSLGLDEPNSDFSTSAEAAMAHSIDFDPLNAATAGPQLKN